MAFQTGVVLDDKYKITTALCRGRYLILDRLGGEDVATMTARRGPLPVGEAVDVVLQACDAVNDAHAQGVVHGDLTPANLLVTTDADGRPRVSVLASGASGHAEPDGTTPTRPVATGSPLYICPERLRDPSRLADESSDLWSLGVILYELLAGWPPFTGDSDAVLARATRGSYPKLSSLRSDVPPAIDELLAKLLVADRRARPASVAAFAAALAPFATGGARSHAEHIARVAAHASPRNAPPRVMTHVAPPLSRRARVIDVVCAVIGVAGVVLWCLAAIDTVAYERFLVSVGFR